VVDFNVNYIHEYLFISAGLIDAKVVQVDAANDLALLKEDGWFAPLPIAASRTGLLGGKVATVDFPDIDF
jgi:S1-C subfamily serine protease